MDMSSYVVLMLLGSTEDTNVQMSYPDLVSTLKKNWNIMKMRSHNY